MRHLPILLLVAALHFTPKAAVSDIIIDVVGGDQGMQDDLSAAASLMAIDDLRKQTAQDVIAKARSDYARLLATLYERGFFGPEISIKLDGREAADISAFASPPPVRNIHIIVAPGERFQLGQADIGPLAPGTTLPEAFKSGEQASTAVLRQATAAAIADWRDAGHATAQVAKQQITARHDKAKLNAQIILNPGPLVYFGALDAQGQKRMHPEAIARIASLPTGAQFDPELLEDAARRLRDTGVFSSVALSEGSLLENDILPIQANLSEAPLRRLGFGAELSSSEGATLSAYWLHRNLFGGAERLRFDTRVSGLGGDSGGYDALASVNYSIPAVPTPDTRASIGATVEHLDETTFSLDMIELRAGLEHRFSDTLSGSLHVSLAHAEISDAFAKRNVTLLSFPAALIWDHRDTPSDARQGWYLSTTVTPFALTQGAGGLRWTADARAYRGFGKDNGTRLALRLQMGTLEGADITALPPDWLFFSGGSETVRGQSYQSLGAFQNGEETGGRSFFASTLEMRQDLYENIGAVLFADVAYVAPDAHWQSGGAWHSGAGLGARYNTPIGPIRVDLATPVSNAGESGNLHLYIGIGQAF